MYTEVLSVPALAGCLPADGCALQAGARRPLVIYILTAPLHAIE